MVFSNFVRTESGNQVFFKNSTPIENVGSLKFYKDDSSGSFSKKEFRWSFNGNYWASWEVLNQGNLTNTDVRGNPCLYIEVRYVKTNNTSKVNSFSVNYTESKIVQTHVSDNSSSQTNLVSCADIKDEACSISCSTESTSSCTLLDGKPGSFYLWRPNHKGTQTISTISGLQEILNNLSLGIQNSVSEGRNVAGTGIGVFYEKIDQALLFKRIDVSTGISITDSSGIITLSVDSSLVTKDPSINELYSFYYSLESSLFDLSFYIDSKFVQIDSSIIRIDSSLLKLDASLTDLYNTKVNRSGDTITGSLTVDGSLLVNGNTFYVDISNNRVGVRTTLPEAPLHVLSSTGDIMYVQRAGQSKFNLGAGSVSGTSYLRWGLAPSGVALVIGANSAVEIGANSHIANLGLGDIYVNRYGFFEDGIGIGAGTTIPQYTLDVSGNIHSSGSVVFDSSLCMNSKRIQCLGTPLDVSDAVNRWFFDVSIQQLRFEQPWTIDNSVLSPASADYDIQLSSIQMQTDGGQMTLVDMTITAAEASGNIHGYSFDIDGSKALRIEAVADGSLVGISQKYIVETVDYHYIGEPSADGSWRYFIDASTDLQFQKRVAGIWVNSQKLSV